MRKDSYPQDAAPENTVAWCAMRDIDLALQAALFPREKRVEILNGLAAIRGTALFGVKAIMEDNSTYVTLID